jgi:hypothetical protein
MYLEAVLEFVCICASLRVCILTIVCVLFVGLINISKEGVVYQAILSALELSLLANITFSLYNRYCKVLLRWVVDLQVNSIRLLLHRQICNVA